MPKLSDDAKANIHDFPHDLDRPVDLPRTRDGRYKRRLTIDEKLLILDPTADPDRTYERVVAFKNLFAYRVTDGIITRASGGARDWTTMLGPIEDFHVIRHLLADRLLPVFQPRWIGSRSYGTTDKIILDLDADPPPDPVLYLDGLKDIRGAGYRDIGSFQRARDSALSRAAKRKPLAERLVDVFDALRRMGINPDDSRQVLKWPSPSGGLHVYVFLDGPYHIIAINDLLEEAGLVHSSGQIEFFPSTRRALRLPFGCLPGRTHNPRSWIDFVDDYASGRIIRHSIGTMSDKLLESRRLARSGQRNCPQGELPPPAKQAHPRKLNSSILGLSKQQRLQDPSGPGRASPRQTSLERYLVLLERGPKSSAEAEELLVSGILQPGTRTRVLLHLAIHFTWFRHLSAEEAGEFLTRWALDGRHRSKDIETDMANGSTVVEDQIRHMCLWCEREKKTTPRTARPWEDRRPRFAASELEVIRPFVHDLGERQRTDQIHLFLNLLAFGKHHGRTYPGGSGRDFGLAIKAVVLHWPGCRGGNKYKTLMDRALESGLLTMIRDKWQPKGRKGRARTYRLSIPVADPGDEPWIMPRQWPISS